MNDTSGFTPFFCIDWGTNYYCKLLTTNLRPTTACACGLQTIYIYIFPIRSFSYWKGPSKEILYRTGKNPPSSLPSPYCRGCVYFIFPHIITVVRQSSRGRTFSAVTKKWGHVWNFKIAHDLRIVVPRACAKIKKNRRHSFRARRDDAFCD